MAWDLVMRHHNEQKLIARNTVAELGPLWHILDFHELEESTPDWLRAARPVVEKGYLVSQWTALQFAQNYRSMLFGRPRLPVELPNPLGTFSAPQIPDRNRQIAIMVSLKVTGPIQVAKKTLVQPAGSVNEAEAMAAGFSKSAGAAIRHVLNGGRGMIRVLADADELALGVAGVADEGCCDSCHFLETPILKKTATARQMDAIAVGHDACVCSARLVY